MTIAPVAQFPERGPQSYDRVMAPSRPGMQGPLRHEEGIATDTDVPGDFVRGAFGDPTNLPGTRYNNPEMVFKHANETMRERAHLGSASWEDAPTRLQDFVMGARTGDVIEFERVMGSESRQRPPIPATILD